MQEYGTKLYNICLQNETVHPKSQKVLPLQSSIKRQRHLLLCDIKQLNISSCQAAQHYVPGSKILTALQKPDILQNFKTKLLMTLLKSTINKALPGLFVNTVCAR
jgi:hypothetical protein